MLPIEFEIEKRQLMYLYRILQLESTDPVSKLFWDLKKMSEAGETNWWTGVEPSLEKYHLPTDLGKIKGMSKDCFARKVKDAVTKAALSQLQSECQSLKKTASLQYEHLELQDYLKTLFPSQARTVFKWRSGTLDLKTHLTYKYDDTLCRGCKNEPESPEHAVNCGTATKMDIKIDVLTIDKLDDFAKSELKQMVSRINSFLARIADGQC